MAKSRQLTLEDYDGFVEKFKPKRTTDDCYTPPAVYECVRQWVNDNIRPLDGLTVRRPFYPGGDYQAEAESYGPSDVVIDNPPFSILSKIVDFYQKWNIPFFLFAPGLTLFSAPRDGVSCVVAACEIIYDNGAVVRTSFLTNMEGRHRIIVAGDLHEQVAAVVKRINPEKARTNRYYPPEVVTAAQLGKIVVRGVSFKVPFAECAPCRKLDNQSGTLFGYGFLLSERATAERMAAERMAAERMAAERMTAERMAAERAVAECIRLSDREREIVRVLSQKCIG